TYGLLAGLLLPALVLAIRGQSFSGPSGSVQRQSSIFPASEGPKFNYLASGECQMCPLHNFVLDASKSRWTLRNALGDEKFEGPELQQWDLTEIAGSHLPSQNGQ